MNRMKISTIALAATAIVALGCGAGSTGDKKATDANAPTTGTSVGAESGSKPKAPAQAPLTAKDIKLTVKILSKHCFGSAGCNLEFRISTVTLPQSKLDKDATYEITYTYKGLEDPVEGTFTLNGDGSYETDAMEFGSSKSKAAKVTAVVTGVEKM